MKDTKVKLSGKEDTFKDSENNILYPIKYNNQLYVPIESLSKSLELNYKYDDTTNTLAIDNKININTTTKAYIDGVIYNSSKIPAILDYYGKFYFSAEDISILNKLTYYFNTKTNSIYFGDREAKIDATKFMTTNYMTKTISSKSLTIGENIYKFGYVINSVGFDTYPSRMTLRAKNNAYQKLKFDISPKNGDVTIRVKDPNDGTIIDETNIKESDRITKYEFNIGKYKDRDLNFEIFKTSKNIISVIIGEPTFN